MVRVIFKGDSGEQEVDAEVGDTLLEVAKKHNIELYGGCDGSCICGTCHVKLDSDHINVVNSCYKITDEELDILDIVDDSDERSRLACQVRITEELDGMIIVIP